jgi:hypothetical protein
MANFNEIITNNLPEIHMIAGDEQTLIYNVWDDDGNSLDLTDSISWIVIFRYGQINNVVAELSGSQILSGSSYNQFSVVFSGSGLPAGVYQQQVKILDSHGRFHVPSQGKIVMYPSPTTGSFVGSI